MSCSSCTGNLGSLGLFKPGNVVPAWLEAKVRTGTPGNWVVEPRMRGLGQSFDITNLGMAQWISGIPNIAVVLLGVALVMTMKK